MKDILSSLASRKELSYEQLKCVVEGVRDESIAPGPLGAFLFGLVMKGVTAGEVISIARIMRDNCDMIRPDVDRFLVDTCGTGGGLCTYNVSSANSIVTAAAGHFVAKHGSRSISASSGSADVLEQLGIVVEVAPQNAKKLIEETGYSFLYAPNFHPIMMKVFGPESELGIKTVFFTVIGPLINPAGAKRQVIGVYQSDLVPLVAECANSLGIERALVVHGVDGIDEVSIMGDTRVAELRNGSIDESVIAPEDLGLRRCQFEEIQGGSPRHNAQIVRELIAGDRKGPCLDFLLANAAASLYVCDSAGSLKEGVQMAREIIESGKASRKLAEIVAASAEYKRV